ncbi:Uncharacterised protein [Actinomyces bovis]|uniref:DUF559 domain-containing protein n=1 Tax=Actinomyces bovis TaxID=1658 RepID=A0ABY1VQP3_9ACTO|nr:Uncharacterised protein [Actinomyces bovis]VEG55932.1 Uncharacterised protein [Actinomyces israelii]
MIHLAVSRGRSHLPLGIGKVVVHHLDGLVFPGPLEPPFADPESALVTTMRCASELDALIALDAALRIGLVSRSGLLARLTGNRNAPMRALLARANPGARSLLETIARYDLQQAGQNPQVAADVGYELDLLLGHLDVETDGHAFHSERRDWEKDRVRDQWLLSHGYQPLRLTSAQVLSRQTVELVRPVAERMGCWR